MSVKKIGINYFEIDTVVNEIIFGNTYIDEFSGWANIEYTIMKLRTDDGTIMIFKPDNNLFTNLKKGESIKIYANEWKPNIYHFKKKIE